MVLHWMTNGGRVLEGDRKFLASMIVAGIIIVIIGLEIKISYSEELALFITPLLLSALIFISMHLQGIPLSIESSLGKSVRKVPHYVGEGDKKKSVPKEWRLHLIKKTDKESDKRIRAICGECNNIDSIKYALENGFTVELICGPSVKDAETRSLIMKLLQEHSDNFNVYISDDRPKKHSTLLGNNILLESIHVEDDPYDKAVLIENANDYHVSHFISKFNHKKPKNKATVADIEKMGLYTKGRIASE